MVPLSKINNTNRKTFGPDSHKYICEHKTPQAYYNRVLEGIDFGQTPCPFCGSMGSCLRLEKYPRKTLEFLSEADAIDSSQRDYYAIRVRCTCCSHSHAVPTQLSPPYRSHSYAAILTTLQAFYNPWHCTIDALCDSAGISTSTLYEWRNQFEEDLTLFLPGIAEKPDHSQCFSLCSWLLTGSDFSLFLKLFALVSGKAFLQTHRFPDVIRQEDLEEGGLRSVCISKEISSCSLQLLREQAFERLRDSAWKPEFDGCQRTCTAMQIRRMICRPALLQRQREDLRRIVKECCRALSRRVIPPPVFRMPAPDPVRLTAVCAAVLFRIQTMLSPMADRSGVPP